MPIYNASLITSTTVHAYSVSFNFNQFHTYEMESLWRKEQISHNLPKCLWIFFFFFFFFWRHVGQKNRRTNIGAWSKLKAVCWNRNPSSGGALLTEFRERERGYIRRRTRRANTVTYRENSNDETSFRASETFFYRRYTPAANVLCSRYMCENRLLCRLAGIRVQWNVL